jgi:hypothetical protein
MAETLICFPKDLSVPSNLASRILPYSYFSHSLDTRDHVLKRLKDHSTPMSASSLRWTQAIRSCAIIAGHESEAIPFSLVLLAAKSGAACYEFGPSDIVLTLHSIGIQSVVGYQSPDFPRTLSNVSEIELR